MSASNTIACIRELVGEGLIGVIPEWSSGDITSCKALVFTSGRALILGDNGSYWVAPAEDVQLVVRKLRESYEHGVGELAQLLELSGAIR